MIFVIIAWIAMTTGGARQLRHVVTGRQIVRWFEKPAGSACIPEFGEVIIRLEANYDRPTLPNH
jgi:hypothetical protein